MLFSQRRNFHSQSSETHKMSQEISFIILVLLIITVNYSAGLKWIPLKAGDAIPTGAIKLNDRGIEFVGRARHYDEVLPAEVNATFSVIESCNKYIIKRRYEILVSRLNCRWQAFSQYDNVPENIVRGGTALNNEPIYIGKVSRSGTTNQRIESIYLGSKTKNKWSNGNIAMLVCNDNSNWIDTASMNIPNNTVYGGKSEDGYGIYVARLKSGCSIIPGQVIPELGFATADYKYDQLKSAYCQVLVGDPDEYKWMTAFNGEIPDYAVVSSRDTSGEMMYVARINKKIGYIVPSSASKLNVTYDILVKSLN